MIALAASLGAGCSSSSSSSGTDLNDVATLLEKNGYQCPAAPQTYSDGEMGDGTTAFMKCKKVSGPDTVILRQYATAADAKKVVCREPGFKASGFAVNSLRIDAASETFGSDWTQLHAIAQLLKMNASSECPG